MTRRRRALSPAQRRAKARRASAKRKRRLAQVPREKIDRHELWRQQGGICPFCDEPLPLLPCGDVHHDHIFPIALGGHDTMTNSQLLHAICNLRKKRRVWALGVTPHQDVPSARGAARTAAIAAYKRSVADIGETLSTTLDSTNHGGTQ